MRAVRFDYSCMVIASIELSMKLEKAHEVTMLPPPLALSPSGLILTNATSLVDLQE